MDIVNYSKIKKLQAEQADSKIKVTKVERDLSDVTKAISQLNPNQEAKQSVSGYGILTLPQNAANSPVSCVISGKTWANRAGKGDTSPQTISNLDSAKTYLLLNSLGKNVTINTVDTATPKKLTGATSFDFEWTEGKIALYELSTAEATLTEAELGARYHYVDGTKSTISASRLKSVNAQLWNGEYINAVIDGVTGSVNANAIARTTKKIRCKSNTKYYVSGGNRSNWRFEDAYGNLLSVVNSIANPTSPSNAYYMQVYYSSDGTHTQVIINEGIVGLPYEPYKESLSYLPNVGELRSLPNGTKDELSLHDGIEKQRSSDDYIIKAEDVKYMSTGMVNVEYANLQMPKVNNGLTSNGNTYRLQSYPYKVTADDISMIGYSDIGNVSDKILRVFFTKGTTIEQARTALAGKILNYQLASPIVTNVPAQMLTAGAGYTVMWLNDVADAGIYDGGISVLNSELPIKSLKKIAKIDFMTGAETELSIATAVIAADKKSFAHPSLVKDDIVFFEYEYPPELSTVPETTVEYLDSRYIVADTANGKFYTWEITSTNGVGSLVLTEVV